MSIQERRARLSAMIGAITHVFIILIYTVSAFFPDQPGQASGWETISLEPLPGLFLASIFGPLLLYLGSLWVLSQQEKRWLALLSSGAIGSILLALLGLAYFLPELLFIALTGRVRVGNEGSIVLGLDFWFPPPAFFISFCCSLLLTSHLSRMPSVMKKAD